MGVKKPSECRPGEELGEDLYIRGTFYRKGTILTSLVIQDLRRSKITSLNIITPEHLLHPEDVDQRPTLHTNVSHVTGKRLSDLIPSLIDNMRYGQALHHFQITQWLEDLYVSFLEIPQVADWLQQLKYWNMYSYIHSIDVFILSTLLAKEQGLEDIRTFALAALLHDIGKLKVPKHLLEKEGKLTNCEYAAIQSHTQEGARMLKNAGFSEEVQRIAHLHHERIDRSGYPDKLGGESFDLSLKIITIIDVYSALTLNRSYREPVSGVQALEIILKENDKYDRNLCHAFIKMLDLYPHFTEVLLTDGRKGTIIYKDSDDTTTPFIQLENEEIELSLEESIHPSVHSIIGWKSVQLKRMLKKSWYNLLVYLTEGKKLAAIKLIDQFSDDMRLESIYMDLIEQIYIEIEGAAREDQIDPVDERIAYITLLEILNYKMIENTIPIPNISGSTALASLEETTKSLPLKMIDDVLTVNGWQTFFLGTVDDVSLLKACIEKYDLNYITLFIGTLESIAKAEAMIAALKKAVPSLTILVNGPYAYHITASQPDIIQSSGLRDYIFKLNRYMNAS